MLNWVRSRWKEIGEAWRECQHLDPPGYRFGDVPTAEEMAAKAARLEGELSLERARRKTAEETLSGQANAYNGVSDRLADAQIELTRLRGELAGRRPADPPQLTPAQVERLALLIEECGEVAQAVGKVLRHGYESQNPYQVAGPTNRVALERELGDLHAALGLLYAAGDVRGQEVHTWKRKKQGRIGKWLHHQASPAEAKPAWGFSENLEVLPVERKTEAQPAQ